MNENDLLNNKNIKKTGWKKIGELNNLPDSDIKLMQSWLEVVFKPLRLSSRYMADILRTAKMASTRVWADHAGLDIFTHLAIYIPHGPISDGNTWGLFHMERIAVRNGFQNIVDHNINFYLYVERE